MSGAAERDRTARRLAWAAAAVFGAFLVFLVVANALVPALATRVLRERAAERGLAVSWSALRFGLDGEVYVRALAATPLAGGEPLVTVNQLSVGVKLLPLFAGRIEPSEVELYDAGHLDITLGLLQKQLLKNPLHVQFVLGVRGALSATPRNLQFLIERLDEVGEATWGVAGIGRHQLPMAELAARWGGNVRVGLEDNIYLDKGVLAEGSAPLVARAKEICERAGRKVATIAEARQILLGG